MRSSAKTVYSIAHALINAQIRRDGEQCIRSLVAGGGVFEELAEFATLRPDLVPTIGTISVNPVRTITARPFPEIKKELESALGFSLAKLFVSIAHIPSFSDRISQTHRATLRNGTQVLVTVFSTRIESQDRRSLSFLRMASRFVPNALFRIPELIDAFSRERFKGGIKRGTEWQRAIQNAAFPILMPRVIWSHTAHTVLTTEYAKAISLQSYIQDCMRGGPDRLGQSREIRSLAQQTLNAYVKSCLTNGSFIADINERSLLISPEGMLHVFRGTIGTLSPLERGYLIGALKALRSQDNAAFEKALVLLGTIRHTLQLPLLHATMRRIMKPLVQTRANTMQTLHAALRTALMNGVSYRPEIIQFIASLERLEKLITSLVPESENAGRVSRKPQLSIQRKPLAVPERRSPYSINRLATKLELRPAPAAIHANTPQLPQTTATFQNEQLPRAITSAALLVSGAILFSLAPASIFTLTVASCVSGLGILSSLNIVRNRR